jgi:hypothetical protein
LDPLPNIVDPAGSAGQSIEFRNSSSHTRTRTLTSVRSFLRATVSLLIARCAPLLQADNRRGPAAATVAPPEPR